MNKRFLRTVGLIGNDGLDKLKSATVAVFGIGGVGSYALEALVRSGIGTVYIYDNDTVSESNINRQLIADTSTVGLLKTQVAANRARFINPDVKIVEHPVFITNETPIEFEKFDYIIDAVDNVTAKLYLISEAQNKKIPIISVMGTGNKLDPTRLAVSDIYKTHTCPLAKVMRLELKRRGIKKQSVIWSDELPQKRDNTEETRVNGRPAPSSMTFVPATAGLIAAAEAVKHIINS